MRFIIHEMPFELPLRAGLFRYEKDGRLTGAVEQWRVTRVDQGYRFWRVDLDARAAASGQSTLYHLTLNEAGQPEQLKFRFWAGGQQANGLLSFSPEGITLTRTVNGQRFEEEAAGDAPFWFPTTVGLSLLARLAATGVTSLTAVTLNATPHQDAASLLALRQAQLTFQYGPEEELAVRQETHVVRPLLITWDDQQRTLWVDRENWPLRMCRQDGLCACETQYIRYETVNS